VFEAPHAAPPPPRPVGAPAPVAKKACGRGDAAAAEPAAKASAKGKKKRRAQAKPAAVAAPVDTQLPGDGTQPLEAQRDGGDDDDGVLSAAQLAQRYLEKVADAACSCTLLKRTLVDGMRDLCRDARVGVDIGYLDTAGKRKLLPKTLLRVALCPTCTTAEQSASAMDDRTDERVEACFWRPVINPGHPLTVIQAYHLHLQTHVTRLTQEAAAAAAVDDVAAALGAQELEPVPVGPRPAERARVVDSPAAYDLNRFRAHTMKHLLTNWNYYVTKGRVNKTDGTHATISPLTVFFSSLTRSHAQRAGLAGHSRPRAQVGDVWHRRNQHVPESLFRHTQQRLLRAYAHCARTLRRLPSFQRLR
jgi:hypothetical protein